MFRLDKVDVVTDDGPDPLGVLAVARADSECRAEFPRDVGDTGRRQEDPVELMRDIRIKFMEDLILPNGHTPMERLDRFANLVTAHIDKR